jgi:hypothetical protein
MDSLCHAETVKATMLIRDPVTKLLRRPTDADLPGIRDGDAYDAVTVARGVSRAHAAFERFSFDRTGAAMTPVAGVIAYWNTLTEAAIAALAPSPTLTDAERATLFTEQTAAREAAHAAVGEDLTNDYMRATCRATNDRGEASYAAAIHVCRILAGLI